jgi:flagellar protein FliT
MVATLAAHAAPLAPQELLDESLPSIYSYFSEISTAMLEAAQRGDWDSVTEGEQSCARLVTLLQTNAPVATSELERQECMRLIRKILADDAAIRGLAQPLMQELDKILRPASGSRLRMHSFR